MRRLLATVLTAAALVVAPTAAPAQADTPWYVDVFGPTIFTCGTPGFVVSVPESVIVTSASPSLTGGAQYVEFTDGQTVYGYGRVDLDYSPADGYAFDPDQARSEGLEDASETYARRSFTLAPLPA